MACRYTLLNVRLCCDAGARWLVLASVQHEYGPWFRHEWMASHFHWLVARCLLAAREAPRFWHHHHTCSCWHTAMISASPPNAALPTYCRFHRCSARCNCGHPRYSGTHPAAATHSPRSSCLLRATRLATGHRHVLFQVLRTAAAFFNSLTCPRPLSRPSFFRRGVYKCTLVVWWLAGRCAHGSREL